jgi:hypothetical protein
MTRSRFSFFSCFQGNDMKDACQMAGKKKNEKKQWVSGIGDGAGETGTGEEPGNVP